MPHHLLFQFRQVTVPHTVSPYLSLIYGMDTGKMLLQGNAPVNVMPAGGGGGGGVGCGRLGIGWGF